jgi:hypothetical protein
MASGKPIARLSSEKAGFLLGFDMDITFASFHVLRN